MIHQALFPMGINWSLHKASGSNNAVFNNNTTQFTSNNIVFNTAPTRAESLNMVFNDAATR